MSETSGDAAFALDPVALHEAIELLASHAGGTPALGSRLFPDQGAGGREALASLAAQVLSGAPRFSSPGWFAHMDPPTPWVTWAAHLWMAALNQNLLHPDTGEAGRRLETVVIAALAPFFGMESGQLVPGSTVANLTALWAARDAAGVREVVASEMAHLSIEKAARLLGLSFRKIPVDSNGRLRRETLGDISKTAVVLTAGTTSTGSIDSLEAVPGAAWVHVDAAWAGPLRLSGRHAIRLAGIEMADSVAVSAHKWLWQPKDSALILFRDWERARPAISFSGAYLAVPNVGVLGSSAARALPLAATLMALGRDGIAARLDRCLEIAEEFAGLVSADPRMELWGRPQSGVIAWRVRGEPVEATRVRLKAQGIHVSQTKLGGQSWLRSVAIHPAIDSRAAYEAARPST